MRNLLLVLAAAGSLAATAPALAQSVAMRANPDVNLSGFSGDAQALPNAIAAIETATGGRVVEIRYNNVGGTSGYDFVLARGSEISLQRISQAGGAMTELSGSSAPAWMQGWAGRKDARLAGAAKVSLPDAIRTAETAMGGAPAVAAGMAKTAADANTAVKYYNVAILKDGEERRVAVNSDDGAVIADFSVLAIW
jgi:hypothetical protein